MPGEGPPKILLIDDNPTNLQVATAHLQAYAYVILTARDGETGVRRARYTQPDLILLDIDMPGIDGFETCRRLKTHPDTARIPVIYMTAYSGVEDKLRAFELGGVDYVTKPFEASELLARVRTHLTLAAQAALLATEAERLDARVAEATHQLRQESERYQAALAEREELVRLVRLQGDQLRALTERLLQDRADRDRDLARYLRRELTERLRLIHGALSQARQTARADATQESLDRALALLEPALGRTEEVGGQLSEADPVADNPLLRLSTREYEVFQLLVDGRSNKEIAATLGLASTTVSTYRARILDKLQVEDVPALVRVALRFT